MSSSVIHKQVIDLETVRIMTEPLVYEVPIEAELVDIQWDTRNPLGIAFWYRVIKREDPHGYEQKFWSFAVRGTGHEFPTRMSHLATVVRNGYAWHVLDAEGGHIAWAKL